MSRHENLHARSTGTTLKLLFPKGDEPNQILVTKEVADLTGFSRSYFEKGRCYGYGPNFHRFGGKVLYRLADVEAWFAAHECGPKGGAYV